MGFNDGEWFCDVCSENIPLGNKRYPLDSGKICCKKCWDEVHGTSSNQEVIAAIDVQKFRPYSLGRKSLLAVVLIGTFICSISLWLSSKALRTVQQEETKRETARYLTNQRLSELDRKIDSLEQRQVLLKTHVDKRWSEGLDTILVGLRNMQLLQIEHEQLLEKQRGSVEIMKELAKPRPSLQRNR